jgi:hypothetical protein
LFVGRRGADARGRIKVFVEVAWQLERVHVDGIFIPDYFIL